MTFSGVGAKGNLRIFADEFFGFLGVGVAGQENHAGPLAGEFMNGLGAGAITDNAFLGDEAYAHGSTGLADAAVLRCVPALFVNATQQDNAGFWLGLVEGAAGKNPAGGSQYD